MKPLSSGGLKQHQKHQNVKGANLWDWGHRSVEILKEWISCIRVRSNDEIKSSEIWKEWIFGTSASYALWTEFWHWRYHPQQNQVSRSQRCRAVASGSSSMWKLKVWKHDSSLVSGMFAVIESKVLISNGKSQGASRGWVRLLQNFKRTEKSITEKQRG